MNIFKQRRINLGNLMENNSIAYIFSGDKVMVSQDESYPFKVDKNFYYYTGIDREGMVLRLVKINDTLSEMIYALPYDEILAKWEGARLTFEEIKSISAVDRVSDVTNIYEDFSAIYRNYIRLSEDFKVYIDLYRYHHIQDEKAGIKFINTINKLYPNLKILDLLKFNTTLRIIKDEVEIENIKEAIKITNDGLKSIMATIKENVSEKVVEGIFNLNLCKHNSSFSFNPILATGKNATILHYVDNNTITKEGELFLCDLGATYQNYKADISRTYPVNGKFSARQKEIYNLVLNAMKIVEANAKAGISLKELNQLVVDYYSENLPKINLNNNVFDYYFHSIGHQLGLDTHDLSFGADKKLEAGMVITNEPGLYIVDEGIGIRIEDDLLITEEGCINLSKDIIKEIDEIEEFFAKNNRYIKS